MVKESCLFLTYREKLSDARNTKLNYLKYSKVSERVVTETLIIKILLSLSSSQLSGVRSSRPVSMNLKVVLVSASLSRSPCSRRECQVQKAVFHSFREIFSNVIEIFLSLQTYL
jgi:hypothetical protein